MPNKIKLNHMRPASNNHWLDKITLLIGIVAMIGTLIGLQHINASALALQNEIDSSLHPRLESKHLSLQSKEDAKSKEEVIAVQNVMQELAFPWDSLFSNLEHLHIDHVKLLMIEPNAKQHKLRITAQAAQPEDMLAYVKALSAQPMLKDVFLVSQEYTEDIQVTQIRFTVEAGWAI